MSPHITIVGQTGQLASALVRQCEAQNIDLVALSRQDLDLSANERQISNVLEKFGAIDVVIIIAASYTTIDAAEEDFTTAVAINGDAPRKYTYFYKAKDIPLIHVSTDCFYDGSADTPYFPDSKLSLINSCGYFKLLGQQHVLESGVNAVILRTSWIYDDTEKNFFTTILGLAEGRDTLEIVSDQIGCPTYAGHLAQSILNICEVLHSNHDNYTVVYHLTGLGPSVSWADFTREMFKQVSEHLEPAPLVNNVFASEYPTSAKRPHFSVLNMDSYLGRFS